MVNANVKGRYAENRLSTFLTVNGYENELLRLQGVNDPGDLWVPDVNTRIEVKDHKSVQEAINAAIKDVRLLDERFPLSRNMAVVVRTGRGVEDWYCVRRVGAVFPPRQGSEAYMFGSSIDLARPHEA